MYIVFTIYQIRGDARPVKAMQILVLSAAGTSSTTFLWIHGSRRCGFACLVENVFFMLCQIRADERHVEEMQI